MNGASFAVRENFDLSMGSSKRALDIPEIKPGLAIHFIGIGGIGMSGLARICLEKGCRVSGADKRMNDQTRQLTEMGADIGYGEHPELIDKADLVVYSSAVPESHVERRHAALLHIPSIRRGTLLAHLTKNTSLLGVAGTHGKTTTSSMLAMAVREAGMDPTIVVGGHIPAIGGNANSGKDPFWVVETDESDGSFLELNPSLAIVTNIDDDHLEYYGDFYALLDAFRDFVGMVKDPARRILCGDCRNLYALAKRSYGQEYTFYGFSPACDIQGVDILLGSRGSSCEVLQFGKAVGRLEVNVPGLHMLSNAIGVLSAGLALGYAPEPIIKGIASYTGTKRRFEILGNWNGASLIDDYGHHPTEIQATLRALRQFAPARCVTVFQPHRYSRTDQLFDQFAMAFEGVDLLIVTDIYSAGEEPRPGVTSRHLISRIEGVGKVIYAPTLEDVEAALKEQLRGDDSVLFIGAGDVNKVAYRLLEEKGN